MSIMAMYATTCNNFAHFRAMNEALTDESDVVLMDMTPEAPRIDSTALGLTECVILPMIDGAVGFGVNIFTKVCMIPAAVVSDVVVPISYATNVWSGVVIDILADAVVGNASGIGVDVLAAVDINFQAAAMTVLESKLMLAASEEAL